MDVTSEYKDLEPKDFYHYLSNIYASPYPDRFEERNMGYKVIEFLENKVDRSVLVNKLKELLERNSNMKTKFSTILADRYWEKDYTKPIVRRKYNPDQI